MSVKSWNLLLLGVFALAVSACGTDYNVKATPTPAPGSGNSTTTNTNTNTVCNPFGTTGTTNPNGPQISGELYSMPVTYSTVDGQQVRNTIPSVDAFFSNPSYLINSSIFFNNIDVPAENFTQGFSSQSGNAITDASGNILVENFAIKFTGQIQLRDGVDPEGSYQFAVLSDDGSNLYLNNDKSAAFIDNDGEHAPMMACATTTIPMTNGSPVPFELDYYQGPPVQIAAVVLWRKIPAGSPASALGDPSCIPAPVADLTSAQRTQFTIREIGTSGQPVADYSQGILQRGWEPLDTLNYIAPAGSSGNSSCNW